MAFTNEQLIKAKNAKSVEELKKLAEESGVDLTEELKSVTGGLSIEEYELYGFSGEGKRGQSVGQTAHSISSCLIQSDSAITVCTESEDYQATHGLTCLGCPKSTYFN